MNTHLKHYIYFSVGQGGKIAASMIATGILARYLDPAGLGRWTLLIAAANFLHSLFANWLQSAPFLRFGKQEWVEDGTLRQTWGYRETLLIGGIGISVLGLIGFWPWIHSYFHLSILDAVLAFAYFIGLIITIELQTVLQITVRMDRLALAPMLIAIATVPLYLVLWLSHFPHYPVEISLLGTLIITLAIWFAVTGSTLRQTHLGLPRWDAKKIEAFLRFAWPILPTCLLGYLVNWGNQVFIHRAFSNYDVGLYQSAFQVHTLGVTLAVPFTTILLPKLIDEHLQDPNAIARFANAAAPTLFSLWLLMVIPGIAILPWVFIKVYGKSFIGGILPLMALLAGTPFSALGQLYTGLFTVQGKLGTIFWIVLTTVAVNFLGAWVIVPHPLISVRTISFAFTASFIFSQFLLYYSQHRILGVAGVKMNMLSMITLLFAIGESILVPFGWRMLWSGLITLCLVGLVRQGSIIDGPLLKRLFSGRLIPLGHVLENILVADRKTALS